MLKLVNHKLPIVKLSVRQLIKSTSMRSNQVVVVSMVMFTLNLSQEKLVLVLNLLMISRVVLFQKNIFQQLKKVVLKLWLVVFLQVTLLKMLKLLYMMVLIMMLTHLRWRLNLLHLWVSKKVLEKLVL